MTEDISYMCQPPVIKMLQSLTAHIDCIDTHKVVVLVTGTSLFSSVAFRVCYCFDCDGTHLLNIHMRPHIRSAEATMYFNDYMVGIKKGAHALDYRQCIRDQKRVNTFRLHQYILQVSLRHYLSLQQFDIQQCTFVSLVHPEVLIRGLCRLLIKVSRISTLHK